MTKVIRFFRVGAFAFLFVGGIAITPCFAQVNANKQGQGQGQGANANVGANARGFNGISQSPWFGNTAIRQQLQLNDEQYDRLNKAYTQAWSRYNQGVTGLDKNLAEEQRLQRQRSLTESFNKEFGSSIDETLADKAARQRYNQMDLQYRGYGAFNDPTLQQKLNLTDEQRKQIGNYQNEWDQQFSTWQAEFPKDRDGVRSRFRDARQEWQKKIDSTLTPDQRTMWRDMSGKPFDFPVDVYFQGNAESNSSLKPASK